MMTCETQAAAIGAVVLPGTTRAARIVRRFASDLLGPDLVSLEDLTLCVTELVANAVVHTISGLGGFVTVELSETEKEIRVDVIDDGGTSSVPRLSKSTVGEGGRGLMIVDRLAISWGVHDHKPGTTVWFTVAR